MAQSFIVLHFDDELAPSHVLALLREAARNTGGTWRPVIGRNMKATPSGAAGPTVITLFGRDEQDQNRWHDLSARKERVYRLVADGPRADAALTSCRNGMLNVCRAHNIGVK